MEILTFDLSIDWTLILLIVLMGAFLTDRIQVQRYIEGLERVHVVAIIGVLLSILFVKVKDLDWIDVLVSYSLANVLYSHILKLIKQKFISNNG